MSRKDDIRKMASHVGNSAAHIAIYREGAEREISVYMGIASEIAEKRSWNEREVGVFKELAIRRASSVIKERIRRGDLDEKEFGETLERARDYIEEFAREELEGEWEKTA